MKRLHQIRLFVLLVAGFGCICQPAQADVLCKSRTGVVRVRTTCKPFESTLDPVSLSPSFSALESQVAAHQSLLAPVSLEDEGATLRISGVNVQVVSGSGQTDATPNGRGNVIVGYDEGRCHGDPGEEIPCSTDADCASRGGPCDFTEKAGSHNLVVGPGHQYPSVGGLVAGSTNTVSAPNSTVGGGFQNRATGGGAAVAGGFRNLASGGDSAVCGGQENQASGDEAVVAGGMGNSAQGAVSAVVGGTGNGAHGFASLVAGGDSNGALGGWATEIGGQENGAPDDYQVTIGQP